MGRLELVHETYHLRRALVSRVLIACDNHQRLGMSRRGQGPDSQENKNRERGMKSHGVSVVEARIRASRGWTAWI
jgi:hypothetical protein